MDETGSIKGIGKGFLNESGQIKSRDQLKSEDTKAKKESKSSAANATDFSATLGNAISSVRSRFREDTNKVISAVNVNDDQLKEAKKITEKQLEAAKQLKTAIKDNDTDAIEARKKELDQLDRKRADLVEQIDRTNTDQKDLSHKKISLGSEQKGIVEVKQVEFKKSDLDTTKIATKDDVNDLIESFKNDLVSIKTQRQDQRETRAEVKEIVNEGEKELASIEKDSLKSYEDASRHAERLASDIRQSSMQVFSNVSVSAVQRLLSA